MDKFDAVDIYDENKNKTGKIKVRYKDTLDSDEFIEMFNDGDIVYNVNIDRNDYLKCLELLEIK